MHMYMHGKFAIDCWKEANFWCKIESYMMTSGSFSSIIFNILGMLEVENRARFVAILWSIWSTRNTYLWEQKPVNAHASGVLALDTIRDYMWCHRLNDDVKSTIPAWYKPQADWIKCNVDCAFFETVGKFDVGICF